MIKPEANYMWVNVDNTIQIIESQIDLINRKIDLYDPKFCSQDNDVVHRNHLILLENLCQWKNKIIFSMCLSPNVHSLINGSLSWKVVSIQGRISRRHFHHLKMNFYLHQKILPWKRNILFIQWKILLKKVK